MLLRMEKIVRITLDPSGLPVPDEDPIFVRVGDGVSWTAEFAFTIRIPEFPELHGTETVVLFDPGTYKYSITANGRTNDPEIVVLADELEMLSGSEDGNDW